MSITLAQALELEPGDQLQFGKETFEVVEVTQSFRGCNIRLKASGDRGETFATESDLDAATIVAEKKVEPEPKKAEPKKTIPPAKE